MSKQLAIAEAREFVDAFDQVIQESYDNSDYGWNTVRTRGDDSATYTGGQRGARWFRPVTSLNDRDEGRYVPYYYEEQDLDDMRLKARNLGTFTSVAVGAMQALSVYTMGGEWEYKFSGKHDAPQQPSAQLLAELNAIVKATLERNQWIGDFDCELHDNSRQDGDLLVAGYKASDGTCDFRWYDGDMVRQPASDQKLNQWLDLSPKNSWTFGVHTIFDERIRRIDHERAVGYHVVFDDGGREWDYLPAWPQPHGDETLCGKFGHLIKRNTIRRAKRGVTDYWPVQTDLERDSKLSENLSVGAAILAGIPWFESYAKGTTRDQAATAMERGLDLFSRAASANRAAQGDTRTVQKRPPGTIVKASKGIERTMGPLGQVRQPIYIEVCQHLRKTIGVRWLMPEYMISGDASNANFASTIVSESPFVKAREADQRFYVAQFKALLWRAIKVAFDHGRFDKFAVKFQQIVALCELNIQPPMVASRDKASHLAELDQLWNAGLLNGNEYRIDLKREPKPEYENKTYEPPMIPGQVEQGLADIGAGDKEPPGAQPGGEPAKPEPKPDGPTGGGEKPPTPAGDRKEQIRAEAFTRAIEGATTVEEARAIAGRFRSVTLENCGTGAGGFQAGNDCQCDDGSCGGGVDTAGPKLSRGVEDIEFHDFTMKAFRNPTASQAAAFMEKHGEIRGIFDADTGDCYLWKAGQATHDQVAEKLGMDWGTITGNGEIGRFVVKNPSVLQVKLDRIDQQRKEKTAKESRAQENCGANAEGGGGFQSGNTCGDDEGDGPAVDDDGKPKQKRAQKGGEIGPNGEHYKGGAFIATTEMPKKLRDKRDKAAAQGVLVEPGKREMPEPGKISIWQAVGTFANPRTMELNDQAIAYYRHDRAEVSGLIDRYKSGERYIDVADNPKWARFDDMARMAKAGKPIPGDALTQMAKWRGTDVDQLKTDLGVKKLNPNSDKITEGRLD